MKNFTFLEKTLNISEKYCGAPFVEKISSIRNERERFLNNQWNSESQNTGNKQNLTRKSDLETITYYAEKNLSREKYIQFVYDIAGTILESGELEYSEDLYLSLINEHRIHLNEEIYGYILQKLGIIHLYKNNFQSAQSYYFKSIHVFQRLENIQGITKLKNDIGALLVEQGLYQEGKIFFEEANKISLSNNLNSVNAQSEMNLGNIYYILGMKDQSLQQYQKSLTIAINEKNQDTITLNYINTANVYKLKECYAESLIYINKAFDVIKQTNNKYFKSLAYLLKAELLCFDNKLQSSLALATSAFTVFSEIGDKLSIADTYRILGKIHYKRNKYSVALSYFENSIKINHQFNNLLNLGEVHFDLGCCHLERNKKKEAKQSFKSALDYFNKFDKYLRPHKIEILLKEMLS